MNQVWVWTWPDPGLTLADPVQWGPGPGPANGWTQPGGPGPGLEKIPRTWARLDLGQSNHSTNNYCKDDKKRKGNHSVWHISDYMVCLLKFLLYLSNAVTGNLAIFTWLTTNKPTLIIPWTNLIKHWRSWIQQFGRYVCHSYTCSLQLQTFFCPDLWCPKQRTQSGQSWALFNYHQHRHHECGCLIKCMSLSLALFHWYLMNHLRQGRLMLQIRIHGNWSHGLWKLSRRNFMYYSSFL